MLNAVLLAVAMSLNGVWSLQFDDRTIPAEVPGDVHIALEQAGLIPDPMIGTNVWGLFTYEAKDWAYSRSFAKLAHKAGERVILRFAGVDTRADYYLNGEKLGASENMFVPVEFDITGRQRETNALKVVLKSPLRDPNEPLGVLGRTRVGGTDVEGIRKAQHSFGWDIMPRLVSCGIWKDVTLETRAPVRFDDVHWMTVELDPKTREAGMLICDADVIGPKEILHAAELRLKLVRNGKTLVSRAHPLRYFQNRDYFEHVKDCELWWPRDAGAPALYDAVSEVVSAAGEILACDVRAFGIRTIEWQRRDWYSEQDPGTFRFLVNGEPIYMHGCDVTPMDALHSRDRAHERKCLDMLVDLNCNMIRVWGGGVYESDAFYDFCDRNGILVWQDFMMGNVEPEQCDRFAQAIEKEARDQVRRLRGHASLAIWCGNNEQDRSVGGSWGRFAPDPEKDRISREVLPRVLRDFDPMTPYIPSSPWWTPEVVAGKAKLSQDHLWGPRQQFFKGDYWCNNTPTFVSEMGCHGCPNYASLVRMMSKEGLYPWPDPQDKFRFSADWGCKATCAWPEQGPTQWYGDGRNSLMPRQVKMMFGSVPDDLKLFSEQSQMYQAQALKYWIELFRARKGRTWGLLWWNLRDGWPILSDGVVDYYFGKKKAYEAIKSVQQPQLVTLVEKGRLVAVNDRLYPVLGKVTATDVDSGEVVFSGEVQIPANGTKELAVLAPAAKRGCVRITYVFEDVVRTNPCLYGEPPYAWAKVVDWTR